MTPCRCLIFTLVAVCVGEEYEDLSFPSPVQTGIPSSICLTTWTFRRDCFVALTLTVLRSQARFSNEAFALLDGPCAHLMFGTQYACLYDQEETHYCDSNV